MPGELPRIEESPASTARAASMELEAVLRLLSCRGIGPGRLARVVGCLGSAREALEAPVGSLASAAGIDLRSAAEVLRAAADCRADQILDSLRLHRAFVEMRLGTGDRGAAMEDGGAGGSANGESARASRGYPQLLLAAPDPPWILLGKGMLEAPPEPAVAIVGSRRATSYGRLHAGRMAAELAERGMTIVSGGARGIDAEAHRAALRARGRTIAVLASGFDHPYPPEHRDLFEAIVDGGGAVVTEQLPSIEPRADLFPRRNRIIAALSLVTVVIEAADRSGALLTARIAVEDLSRDAACMPGSVDSVASAGCHRAIREGWATLVRDAADVCELVAAAKTIAVGAVERACTTGPPVQLRAAADASVPVQSTRGAASKGCAADLSRDAQVLRELLRRCGPAGLDELERSSELPVHRIAVAALELELAGLTKRDHDGAYRLARDR